MGFLDDAKENVAAGFEKVKDKAEEVGDVVKEKGSDVGEFVKDKTEDVSDFVKEKITGEDADAARSSDAAPTADRSTPPA